jgi:LysR family hydrogen peroxide-inducible transcriptional activator
MKALPSPRQLQYLLALLETGHFGRAAAKCHVTQSTLSAGLRELEALLGVTLVERSRHHVVITPLGRVVAAHAQTALRTLEDIVEIAAGSHGALRGPLNLGVIPTIGPYVLPTFMVAASTTYPDMQLYVREDQTAPLLERLRRGELDLALIALPYDTGDLKTCPLGDEEVMACVPKTSPLTAKASLSETDLAQAPMLTLEDGHCLRNHALRACRLSDGHFNEVFQSTSLATLVQMVAAGLGVTMIPRMAIKTETAGRDVAVRPLADSAPARTVVLCWRKGAVRDADYDRLGAHFRKVFADFMDESRADSH